MKKVLCLLFLIVSLSVFAQSESEANTLEHLMRKVPDNDPVSFWIALNKHPQYIAVEKALKNKTKSMMEAQSNLPNIDRFRVEFRKALSEVALQDEKVRELINRIEDITKLGSISPYIKFYVVPDNTPQAVMSIDGTCRINSYWLNPGIKSEELVGICCHEAAHYLLFHHLRDVWKKVKAAKRNAFWAEFGTVFTAVAYAGSQINAAQYGVAQSSQAQQQMYNSIQNAGIIAYNKGQWYAENRQKWLYMRETETEADVVAFWFMEKNGIDPKHFINVLRKLAPYEPKLTKQQKKVSNHPELSERIKLLEKLYKKHHNTNQQQNVVLSKYNQSISAEIDSLENYKYYIDKRDFLHSKSTCMWLISAGLDHPSTIKQLEKKPRICKYCIDKNIEEMIKMEIESNPLLNVK